MDKQDPPTPEEVLDFHRTGHTQREIARRLGRSEKAIRRVLSAALPQEALAGTRRALARATTKGAPPDVVARYEAEVRRLEQWIAEGAPIPPAYVSPADLAPLTRKALVYWLARETKDDPEMAALAKLAQDETADETARLEAMHRLVESGGTCHLSHPGQPK